jgi:hypothetical protein
VKNTNHNAFKVCRDSFTCTKNDHKLLTDSFHTGVRHATTSLYEGPVTTFLEAATVIYIQGGALCQLHAWIKLCPDQGECEREHERERELLTNSRAQTKAIANASTY